MKVTIIRVCWKQVNPRQGQRNVFLSRGHHWEQSGKNSEPLPCPLCACLQMIKKDFSVAHTLTEITPANPSMIKPLIPSHRTQVITHLVAVSHAL